MICYLIRHGQDDDSVRGGWSDAPLVPESVSQVEALAIRLAKDDSVSIGRIYTSDLRRARQTADLLASRLDLPVIELPAFRETNNGLLAGMKNETANRKYPGLYWSSLGWDERYPGGESPHEFFDRICDAWQTFKEIQSAGSGGDIALVTHAGVINVIRCLESNVTYTNKTLSFPIKHAEWTCVEI